jgi:hypothetical protein
MDTVDVPAIANIGRKDLARALAQWEAYEINDFILQVVEETENPLLAKSFADALMQYYNRYMQIITI